MNRNSSFGHPQTVLSTAASISFNFFFSLASSSFSTSLSTLPEGRHQRQGGAAPLPIRLRPLQTPPPDTSEPQSPSSPEGLFILWIDSVCNWRIRRKERKELPWMAGAENSGREGSGALPMGHLAGKSVDESAQVAARCYKKDQNRIF